MAMFLSMGIMFDVSSIVFRRSRLVCSFMPSLMYLRAISAVTMSGVYISSAFWRISFAFSPFLLPMKISIHA